VFLFRTTDYLFPLPWQAPDVSHVNRVGVAAFTMDKRHKKSHPSSSSVGSGTAASSSSSSSSSVSGSVSQAISGSVGREATAWRHISSFLVVRDQCSLALADRTRTAVIRPLIQSTDLDLLRQAISSCPVFARWPRGLPRVILEYVPSFASAAVLLCHPPHLILVDARPEIPPTHPLRVRFLTVVPPGRRSAAAADWMTGHGGDGPTASAPILFQADQKLPLWISTPGRTPHPSSAVKFLPSWKDLSDCRYLMTSGLTQLAGFGRPTVLSFIDDGPFVRRPFVHVFPYGGRPAQLEPVSHRRIGSFSFIRTSAHHESQSLLLLWGSTGAGIELCRYDFSERKWSDHWFCPHLALPSLDFAMFALPPAMHPPPLTSGWICIVVRGRDGHPDLTFALDPVSPSRMAHIIPGNPFSTGQELDPDHDARATRNILSRGNTVLSQYDSGGTRILHADAFSWRPRFEKTTRPASSFSSSLDISDMDLLMDPAPPTAWSMLGVPGTLLH
jgi:hypothetical protein